MCVGLVTSRWLMIFLRVNSVLRLPCAVGSFPPSPACLQGWGGGGVKQGGVWVRDAGSEGKRRNKSPGLNRLESSVLVITFIFLQKQQYSFYILKCTLWILKWISVAIMHFAHCPGLSSSFLWLSFFHFHRPNLDFIEFGVWWKRKFGFNFWCFEVMVAWFF